MFWCEVLQVGGIKRVLLQVSGLRFRPATYESYLSFQAQVSKLTADLNLCLDFSKAAQTELAPPQIEALVEPRVFGWLYDQIPAFSLLHRVFLEADLGCGKFVA